MFLDITCENGRRGKYKPSYNVWDNLRAFATDAASKLNVLGEDDDAVGVDGTKVGVFEQVDKVGFTSFLESHDRMRLETEIRFEILRNLALETLDWQLAKEKLRRFLVFANLAEGHSAREIAVRLLDALARHTRLTGCLVSECFAGSFPASRLPGSLLGTCMSL